MKKNRITLQLNIGKNFVFIANDVSQQLLFASERITSLCHFALHMKEDCKFHFLGS